jgi:hypothetical protein
MPLRPEKLADYFFQVGIPDDARLEKFKILEPQSVANETNTPPGFVGMLMLDYHFLGTTHLLFSIH